MSVAELPDPLPIGYQLGPYVVESELPPTRMGRAYCALVQGLSAAVALIVLRIDIREEMGRMRFERGVCNASLAGQPVHDYGEWLGVPFVAAGYQEEVGPLVDIAEWTRRAVQQ